MLKSHRCNWRCFLNHHTEQTTIRRNKSRHFLSLPYERDGLDGPPDCHRLSYSGNHCRHRLLVRRNRPYDGEGFLTHEIVEEEALGMECLLVGSRTFTCDCFLYHGCLEEPLWETQTRSTGSLRPGLVQDIE